MKLEFDLSFDARERLWAIKEAAGKSDLSANDFARELLEAELWRLFPGKPDFDEQGKLTNPEGYRKPKAETGSRKEALINLLREYRLELAQAEYTAEVKDPIRLDIMDTLWKAENILTGEEALRKYDTRVRDNPARYHRDGIAKPEEAEGKA